MSTTNTTNQIDQLTAKWQALVEESARLRDAWADMLSRHPGLRTTRKIDLAQLGAADGQLVTLLECVQKLRRVIVEIGTKLDTAKRQGLLKL